MHLKKSDIISYIDDSMSEIRRVAVDNHVRICAECARKLSVMKAVISPSSERMTESAIPAMNDNRRFNSRERDNCLKIAGKIRKHPLMYTAASAAVITAAILSFSLIKNDSSAIRASRVKGVVAENTKRINCNRLDLI